MSLSQYQSIVQGFASGNSQKSESAGERFSSAKEGYLQQAGSLRNLIQQQAQNRYSSAIERAEDIFTGKESAYDATLNLYADKVKKYQSEVLSQLGISEEDQAKASAVMGVASTLAPLGGQVGGYLLKRINKSIAKPEAKSKAKPKAKADEAKTEPEAKAEPEAKQVKDPTEYVEDSRGGQSSANYNEEFGASEIQDNEAFFSGDKIGSKRLIDKLKRTREGITEQNEPVSEPVSEPPIVQPGEAGPSNARLPQDIEMQDMTGKTITRNQKQNVLQEQEELQNKQDAEIQDIKDQNLEKVETFEKEGGDPTQQQLEDAGLQGDAATDEIADTSAETAAKIATTETAEIAEDTAASLLADAGTAALETASIASEALGPLGAVVGLGLGVYEIGNAFHWWGGGHSETPTPTPPPAPKVAPPKPPDLEDIPTPKKIVVRNVAPSQSISSHSGLLAAPSMNSNIMRR